MALDDRPCSSVLKKNLSPLSVWSLAFGCIIGWGAFVMPGNMFLPSAGPLGTALGMGLAVVAMTVLAFNYQYMITRIPRSGGEFLYVCQTFGRRQGFVCGWFLSLAYLSIVPLNATALALVGRSVGGGVFQFGFHYNVAGYDVYLGELLLAQGALVLFAWLSVIGTKFAGWFQNVLVLSLVCGVAVVTSGALICSRASFNALTPAFPTGSNVGLSVLSVLAIAPWAFVGFETVPQAAEEFKFPVVKTRWIMMISILFGAFVYVALNTVTAMVVPLGCANWESYISHLDAYDGIMSMPTFFAARELLGPIGLTFLCMAIVAAILSGIIGFYMATSRLLYAMANEGVLPMWFGQVHARYRTPARAIWFVMTVSLVAPLFGRVVLGWVVDMSAVGAAMGFAYTSLCVCKLAYRSLDCRAIAFGSLGLVISLCFLFALLVSLSGSQCGLWHEALLALIVWIIVGGIFYLISSVKRERKFTERQRIRSSFQI